MVRTAAIVFALISAIPASAKEGQDGLPNFVFRGVKAGVITSPLGIGFQAKDCKFGRSEKEISCSNLNDTLAGVSSMSTYTWYDGLLKSLYISFHKSQWGSVLSSLKQKYGDPCDNSVVQWQNRLGSKFDVLEVKWCFSTGALSLKEMGFRQEWSLVSYVDTTVTKQAGEELKAPVDF